MSSHFMLREARRRAGLTQAQLAERAGKATSAISRWERGEVNPSLETLRSLIGAAGFDLIVSLAPTDQHDLTLIRRSLARSPAERMAEMVAAVRALDMMETAGG